MTVSPSWRTALASAATVAALVVAPLVGAGAAYAMDDDPYPHATKPTDKPDDDHDHQYPPKPHPTKPDDHPYPPKPPHPHHPDKPHHPDHPDKPHLADTGDDTKLIMGSAAAGLVAAGLGTVFVARRRRNS
ncbi:LPXTG cell wall anchor domain-containing protein [Streptomyces sp.]|uniref:LPXTG cell wall anchor domain-containing protein n=1 Tax=Streptomyces sp. TaxID=1931 RepID=UPI002F942B4E